MTFGENSLQNEQIRRPQHQQHQPLSHGRLLDIFATLTSYKFPFEREYRGYDDSTTVRCKITPVNVEQSGKTTRYLNFPWNHFHEIFREIDFTKKI